MDDKERADRLAAAEALYMISTRLDKGNVVERSPRRGRKTKRNVEDTVVRRGRIEDGDFVGRKGRIEDGEGGGSVVVGRRRRIEDGEDRGSVVVGRRRRIEDRGSVVDRRKRIEDEDVVGTRGMFEDGDIVGRRRIEDGGNVVGKRGRGRKKVVLLQREEEGHDDVSSKRSTKVVSARGKSNGSKTRRSSKSSQRLVNDDSKDVEPSRNEGNNYNSSQTLKRSSSILSNELLLGHSSDLKRKPKSRNSKKRNQKVSDSPLSNIDVDSKVSDYEGPCRAIGFTGAAISINDPNTRRTSVDSSQNQSGISGYRQGGVLSRNLLSTTGVYGLPSMNLASFTPDLNLPSIPLELGSLQLSSQPTPNLSSLGDITEGILEDNCAFDRKASEKFLPLKKRKLHKPSEESEVREPTPPADTSSVSDSEDQSEPQSPPTQPTEPIRATYTVQAPPIITMQTLMEIKTALTADDDGDLPLHIAVVHENMRMVIKLINLMRIAGKGVDKFNKQQQTPLHLAVKLNFLEAVDILLKSNANVNAVDCTGSSSIHMAVQGRSLQCLAILLERSPSADLNVRNFDGLTPLHIAVDNGDLQQVELLLKFNADIDVTDGKSGRTALFRAAESNQKAMVELLLNKGANPDVPNYAGVTTAMAAQGRNLHGVLKLLGSVAADKFSEYETKPSVIALESKVTPVFVGFSPYDSITFSQNASIKNTRSGDSEIMCMIGPKVNKENTEVSANETKVFHNVFVVSEGQSKDKNENKSISAPSSPELKMDITVDKDIGTSSRSGLMSLPAGFFGHSVDIKRENQFITQGNLHAVKQGQSLPIHKPLVGFSKIANSTVSLVKKEQKPVMLQIVPQSTSACVSTSSINTISSAPNLTPVSILSNLSSKQVSSAPSLVTQPSSTTPLTNTTTSSNDTVTLTGMQARLFQVLLKMYNIDQSGKIPSAPGASQPPSTPSPSVVPKLTLPQPFSLAQSTIPVSSAPIHQMQETTDQSCNKQLPERLYEHMYVIPKPEKNLGAGVSSQNLIHHRLVEEKRNSFERSTDSNISKDINSDKMDETPLNLSTSSSRKDNADINGKDIFSSCLKKSGTVDSANRIVRLPLPSNVVSQIRTGQSPVQKEAAENIISIEIHRIPESYRENGGEGAGQIEMLLLPAIPQAELPLGVASGQLKTESVVALPTSRSVNVPGIHNDASNTKLSERRTSGQIVTPVSNLHNFARNISQNTSATVRNFSPQNIANVQNLNLPVVSQASVPTVLDFVTESQDSAKKHKNTTLSRTKLIPATMVTPRGTGISMSNALQRLPTSQSPNIQVSNMLGKSIIPQKLSNPVPVTHFNPAVSSNAIFRHQNQVIDLSKSNVSESNQSALKGAPSVLNPKVEHGKIIGFSGAILSVVPSNLETPEKQPGSETLGKEVQKKRGRKSLKYLQSLSNSAGEGGLSKINSVTDEKLKKFLDAKKLENSGSVLSDEKAQDERTIGADMNGNETAVAQSDSRLSKDQINEMYKTVGIFSGNLEQVKVGKRVSLSPSLVVSSAVQIIQSREALHLSQSNTISSTSPPGLKMAEVADVSSSKIVEFINPSGKNFTIKCLSENSLITNTGSDCPKDNSVHVSVEDCEPLLSKKSKRSKKSLTVVSSETKDAVDSFLANKKNNSISDLGKGDKHKVEMSKELKNRKKSVLAKEVNSIQSQKQSERSLLFCSLLQNVTNEDRHSDNNSNVKTNFVNSDESHSMKNKRQRRRKSVPKELEQAVKSVSLGGEKRSPTESFGASSTTKDQACNKEEVMRAVTPADKHVRHAKASSKKDNSDSNLEEHPALCIVESEKLD